jgi:hypothetical protein
LPHLRPHVVNEVSHLDAHALYAYGFLLCDLARNSGESLVLCLLYLGLAVSIVVGGPLNPAVVVPYPKIV